MTTKIRFKDEQELSDFCSQETRVLVRCLLKRATENKKIRESVEGMTGASLNECSKCFGYDEECPEYIPQPKEFNLFGCAWENKESVELCYGCDKKGENKIDCPYFETRIFQDLMENHKI